MAAPLQGEIKRGRASLIGGIAVGIGVFALWVALARDLGAGGVGTIAAGFVVAVGVAGWIRIADL
ncbi:MAG TPA: hypothetical protein VFE41_28285 [Acetobacteraceae bacterium]|jgi:hypothetical protein|nr:hypothetical protein [Acetobacteraceae bacterium]